MIDLIHKIKRKWMKIRLEPIRVYCFHQVSDTFDESTMYPDDWLQTDEFKKRVMSLREQGYTFISLADAHEHIKHDFIRIRKYAVLTADDGWASLKNILPWINEQQIPITLFINPAYLDGKHFRNRDTEKYLTEEEVQKLHTQYPLLTIGSHGWDHTPATSMTQLEFIDNIHQSAEYLRKLPNFVPFYAYPWGWCTPVSNDDVLNEGLIPIRLKGPNYNDYLMIQRDIL